MLRTCSSKNDIIQFLFFCKFNIHTNNFCSHNCFKRLKFPFYLFSFSQKKNFSNLIFSFIELTFNYKVYINFRVLVFYFYQAEKFGWSSFICGYQNFELTFKIQFRFNGIILGISLNSLSYLIYSVAYLGLFNLTIKILCIKFIF